MHYIVFDLEFNTLENNPVEIIQFGAVKLDVGFNIIASFNQLVKPSIYSEVNPFVTELTGITTELLQTGELFPEVYSSFLEFIGGNDSVLCVWGMTDIRELFRNASYLGLNNSLLPRNYINIQPYVSLRLDLSRKRLLNLKYSVVALDIPLSRPFHDALCDAYYTAEIFTKIYLPSMQPKVYDPNYVTIRPREVKKSIDFDSLIRQFEKMYAREMTEEEQGIIKLAYRMGRTHQFLIKDQPADIEPHES